MEFVISGNNDKSHIKVLEKKCNFMTFLFLIIKYAIMIMCIYQAIE